jgi:tetratricopeptide (TPR) repeat protein/mono/diheme cytochrome c family protein
MSMSLVGCDRGRACCIVAALFLMGTAVRAGGWGLPQARSAATTRGVTFNRDIAPIVHQHCAICHRPGGGAPFNLLTYADARRRATLIVAATRSRYMPPWKPEPQADDFAGVRRLDDRQLALLQQWVDDGATEGAPEDLPALPQWPSGWQLGEPDVVIALPEPYVLPSGGGDIFRTFVVPIPLTAARYVRALEFRPGTVGAAVHHANIKIDETRSSRRLDEQEPGPGYDGSGGRGAKFPDGHFLGWTPGQSPRVSAHDMAWHLNADSDLVVELHMLPTGRTERVQFSVALYLTDRAPARTPYMVRLGRQNIDIPAGESEHVIVDSYVLPVDVELLSVQAHAHLLAQEVIGYARLPDQSSKSLIHIKTWDFRWQDVYDYATPMLLPRGTTLVMRYRYDNSAGNPRNPHRPPRRVTFGQTTTSEMGDLWLQMVATGSDRVTLARDADAKMLREDIVGDEKALETQPDDPRVHDDLGMRYLEDGRVSDAVDQFEQGIRLDPAAVLPRYHLGTVRASQRRFEEAIELFTEAVKLRPDLSEAYNNLGAVRYAQGSVDEAARWYEQAIRVAPDNAEAHFNLGRVHSAREEVSEAITSYRRFLQLRPDQADARSALAGALASNGEIDEAIVEYRAALRLDPNLPAALVDLAWILATSDRADVRAPHEAVGLAQRVAELTHHQNPTVLDTLGVAYLAAGQPEEALSTARVALELALAAGAQDLANGIRERMDEYERQTRRNRPLPTLP